MATFVAVFLIALTITAVGTPWVRKIALSLGFVDVPSERKAHQTPTPLLGGMAILGGAVVSLLVVFQGAPPRTVLGVLLATSMVALVGLWDDYRPLPAWAKLGGQIAAFLVLVAFGIRVQLPVPDVVNYIITLLWLVGITNAFNFLDNMDGLSAGVAAVICAFILLLALFNDQFLIASLAAALLGACVGFLRYNFPPAEIFMGDVGALVLGFLLAVMGLQLRFPDNVSFVTWMVPVILFGLLIFDMTLVVFSRLRRGHSPNTAGQDHTSHRLVSQGLSIRETVLFLYLICGILGMIALFVTRATVSESFVVGAMLVAAAAAAIWRLDRHWGMEQIDEQK